MSARSTVRLSLMLALAAGLAAAPADAQQKGKAKGKEKSRPELVRRESDRHAAKRRAELMREATKRREAARRVEAERRTDDRWDDDRRDDDRWNGAREEGRRKDVPRGWCQGKGNPHNTPENCGYRSDRDGSWSGSGDRYDSSYDRAHRDFHSDHDRQCRMRAAERPLDLQWQIQVRSECKRRHDDWHLRAGRRHE